MRYYHYRHGWLDGVVLAHDASRGGPLAYPVRLVAPPGGQVTERVILLVPARYSFLSSSGPGAWHIVRCPTETCSPTSARRPTGTSSPTSVQRPIGTSSSAEVRDLPEHKIHVSVAPPVAEGVAHGLAAGLSFCRDYLSLASPALLSVHGSLVEGLSPREALIVGPIFAAVIKHVTSGAESMADEASHVLLFGLGRALLRPPLPRTSMTDTLRARVKLFNQGGFGKLWSQVPFERRLPTIGSHAKAATFTEADRISAAASRAAECAKVHNLRGGIRAMEDTPSAPPDDASHASLRRLMLADAPPREQGSAVETWAHDRALHDPTPRLYFGNCETRTCAPAGRRRA